MMTDRPPGQLHLNNIDPLQDREFTVRKRDGRTEPFNEARILIALESAFKAEAGVTRDEHLDPQWQELVKALAESVAGNVLARAVRGEELEVERIQDAVEDRLMAGGFHAVARRYILYREERRKARLHQEHFPREDRRELRENLAADAEPHENKNDFQSVLEGIYAEALPRNPTIRDRSNLARGHFQTYIEYGVSVARLSPDLLQFDLESLGKALDPDRDTLLSAFALRHLRDDYFLAIEGRVVEVPQYFWMRVAMGLAIAERQNQTARAREFYHALSLLRFFPSASALFHAGRVNPQWIGEYAVSVRNDLDAIFRAIGDGARLAQQGVNVFVNWSAVSAKGGSIAGLTDNTQGLRPFLRTADEATRAAAAKGVNRGTVTASLALWHLEVQDFLRFASESNSASNPAGLRKSVLVPDLFMRRVEEDLTWMLFNPSDISEPAKGFGFETNYLDCERRAHLSEFERFKKVRARDLWRQLLQAFQQTGAFSIEFMEASFGDVAKEEMNSRPSVAALPCGWINLSAHAGADGVDELLLSQTISTSMRILDNCVEMASVAGPQGIDVPFPDRAVALGLVGHAQARAKIQSLGDGPDEVEWMSRLAEKFAYCTVLASAGLAQERGPFLEFKNSSWAQGFLPADRVEFLQRQRADTFPTEEQAALDWSVVRTEVKRHGVRNRKMLTGFSESGPEIFSKFLEDCEVRDSKDSIENGSRCQRWLEMNCPVHLGGIESAEALSETLKVAWKKGLREVHCRPRQNAVPPRSLNVKTAMPSEKSVTARV